MGLFSRKSSEPKTSTQPKKQQINADDIWNTPVKRAGAGNYPQQDGAA